MNNIRLADALTKVWLEVVVNKKTDAGYTVSSQMFDGTPFTITVTEAKIEIDPNDETKALLEVSHTGSNFGYTEIVLPSPILSAGYTVRVKPSQIVQPQKIVMPTKIKKK